MRCGSEMIEITKVEEHNEFIYSRLSQNYEAEFSRLTGKEPNSEGLYEYTICDSTHEGFLLWNEGKPIGFIIVNIGLSRFDVAEFYIIPSKRRGGHGRALAHWAFTRYPGDWQVRQIAGAKWAHAFWVDVIADFTKGYFTDQQESDAEWGVVDIQRFSVTQTL